MVIQWYPGHMTKAKRLIQENLKLVDLVFELRDARIPYSSGNPDFAKILAGKPRIMLLNKADLADPGVTEEWIKYFQDQGIIALSIDALSGQGVRRVMEIAKTEFAQKMQRLQAKGIRHRAIRVMIVGIPNVGKSSLINKLVRRSSAPTGDKPGVTKGKQWVRLQAGLELLDTPGVLWPKFEHEQQGFMLAVTGAISENVFDEIEAAGYLIAFLQAEQPGALVERYKITNPAGDRYQILTEIARQRGYLEAGGTVNLLKAAQVILREFRAGKLGRISLERPTIIAQLAGKKEQNSQQKPDSH